MGANRKSHAECPAQAGDTSSDELPWQDEMRAFIDDDQIPCYLGGSCQCLDSDDGCPSLIPRGNVLPENPVLTVLAFILDYGCMLL